MVKQIYTTFALALIYALAGQMGFLFGLVQYSGITLVWPASGVALAAVLVLGRRALPGIFLGALIINLILLEIPTTPTRFAVVLAISALSTLAALAGSAALRRIAPRAPNATNSRELLQATGALLLISSIVALCGVSIFYRAGQLPGDALVYAWATWFVGDFCGIMLFAPLLWRTARAFTTQRSSLKGGPVITALSVNSAFVVIAIAAFMLMWISETEKISALLMRESAVAANNLKQELREAARDVEGVRNLISTSTSISEHQLSRYITAEFTHPRRNSVQAVGFAQRVTDVAAWEKQMHEKGHASLALYEYDNSGVALPVTQRAEYFPVAFIHPLTGNETVIGFDVYSDLPRRIAMDDARDESRVTMAPVTLFQAIDKQPALFICAPSYRLDAVTDTVAARRANLIGFAGATYLLRPLFEAAVAKTQIDVDLHLFGGSSADQPQWYHTRPSRYRASDTTAAPAPTLASLQVLQNGITRINVAGMNWLVVATPGTTLTREQRTWTPWGVMALILVLGIGISSFMLDRISANEKIAKERRKTEEALREASAANISKAFFMAAACHDIQQPLYALGLHVDTLLMTEQTATSVPILHTLRSSITRMTAHFDSLLEADHFHNSNFDTALVEVRLGEIATLLDSEIAPLCADKGLTWKLDLNDVPVSTDPALLLRLLRNLLSNAISYTDHGQVSCSAKTLGKVVEFRISDTGCGIAAEHQEAIFREYVRLNRSGARSNGFGLGLSIVAKISAALALGLQMSSTPGVGTTFTFRVPRVFAG